MGLKLLTLFAFACIVSVAYTTENVLSNTISPETENELKEADKDVLAIRRSILWQLSRVRTEVDKHVRSGLKPVIDKENKVIAGIIEGMQQAQEHKKDITDCLREARDALEGLGRKEIDKFWNPKELQKAESEGDLLFHLAVTLADCKDECSNTDEDVDACVKKTIKETVEKVKDLQNEITKDIKEISPEKQEECVKNAVPSLLQQISAIYKEWKVCLKNHL